MLETPVAFIIFNRPDLTQLVFEAIAKAKPRKLLVIADGPRSPEEADKCRQARAVIESVDWECEVFTNFSDANLGCRRRVSSGLDWVFEQVEEAIILEDDCLPHSSFFSYCAELLEKYREEESVMTISGDNFYPQSDYSYSYYFSRYPHIWGWATWQRAWKYYDVDIKSWPQMKSAGFLSQLLNNSTEQIYWQKEFDRIYAEAFDTWDYQWTYCCWLKNALSVTPTENMVSNIGFRSDATHTLTRTQYAECPTYKIQNVMHPSQIIRNEKADHYFFQTVCGGREFGRTWIRQEIKNRFRPLKRKIEVYLGSNNSNANS